MSLIVFIFGAIIGSFLSVCIYRLPLSRAVGLTAEELGLPPETPVENIGINSPKRSFCPHCKKQLEWWHNMPIVGWFVLKGKCAFCKTPISFRYPFVELLTALAAMVSLQNFGMTATALLIFAVTCSLIVISFIDYDFYIIPNVISLPGAVLGIVAGFANQYLHIFETPIVLTLTDSLIGVASGAGFLLIVSELYYFMRKQEGLGMGDVKLLALVGAFLGYQGAIFTIFIGSLLGVIGGLLMIVLTKRGMSHPLPFGPYLALGTILYMYLNSSGGLVLFPGIQGPML